jgi:hypothetical protein
MPLLPEKGLSRHTGYWSAEIDEHVRSLRSTVIKYLKLKIIYVKFLLKINIG